jgi:hypothetical protein
MTKLIEVDYVSEDHKGGSPLGTIKIHPGDRLKYAIYRLGVTVLGFGNESHFIYNPNTRTGRFTEKAWTPLVPILEKWFPDECASYFKGRLNKEKLIANRFHKMYYINIVRIDKITGKKTRTRSRGKSPEHPSNWATGVVSGVLSECGTKIETMLNESRSI